MNRKEELELNIANLTKLVNDYKEELRNLEWELFSSENELKEIEGGLGNEEQGV